MLRIVTIALLAIVVGAAPSRAQTTTPTQAAPPSPDAAFDSLSPGNQKIARALFEAQKQDAASATSTTTKALTLDDIAAMKLNGKGWGVVFKEMKAQGLIQERNLGQLVSRANRHAHSEASGTTISTASSRTEVVGNKSTSHGVRADGDGRGYGHDHAGGRHGVGAGHAGRSGHGIGRGR
ncbi:MAG: hypothetical protein HY726_20760 [Candidatus Rokubacteria bacterium]|nr:hypothetical protein [Candidatus Rokubacteria bacterium]